MKILRFAEFVDLLCFNCLIVFTLITRSNQHEHKPIDYNVTYTHDHQRSSASSDEYENVLTSAASLSVPYFRASIPMRIYDCLHDFSTMRCTKLFVLQKMEENKKWPNSGNLTKDFLQQFFGDNDQMGSLISDRYRKMADKDINKRLVLYFQRFFKNRNIKLQFLPGLMVKIVPSPENKLKFSLKKKFKHHHQRNARSQNIGLKAILKASGLDDSSLEGQDSVVTSDEYDIDAKSKNKGAKTKKKHKKIKTSYKSTILQMAVPVMIMPAILMGTFLPFILPVLKMATLTTMIMNNTAFMAALIYAARTHVNAQEEQPINYGYSGGGHIGQH